MDIVTEKNVDAMIEAWETSDFTKPLPPAFEEGEAMAGWWGGGVWCGSRPSPRLV